MTTGDSSSLKRLDYNERFYTPMRRHSKLGYVSPIQFEVSKKA